MKGLLSRRPSPALIISLIALLVAMGGTTYAAFKLPKNSVGGKQLKKNAVTGVKVKDHSLTGADIKLSKLGTVPSATNASHASSADNANHAAVADSANAVAAPEATHLVGAAGEPPFLGGSANFALPEVHFQPAGFYKDREGIVHLQGLVRVGEGAEGAIFALPVGYRPASGTVIFVNVFCTSAFAPGECAEDSGTNEEEYSPLFIAGSGTHLGPTPVDGFVIADEGTLVSLDSVTFRAEG